MNEKKYIIIAFFTLVFFVICTIVAINRDSCRSESARKLDQRYYTEYGRAAETIERLERELGQERQLNQQLREHNNRAREITREVAAASGRNVRNLQDAVQLIGEIRTKLQALAKHYADSDPSVD